MTLKNCALLIGGLGMLAGCSNYYQVRDPQSGNVYYTRMVTDRAGGAVSFEDDLTDRDVTLQESEVARIDRDLYHAKTAHLDVDVDHDHDLGVRPAAARIPAPQPDRQIEIRDRDLDSNRDVNIDVDKGTDVRIKVDE